MSDQRLKHWTEFTPEQARGDKDFGIEPIDLSVRLDIVAPLNEEGERCPWPWEPQQLVGAPMGQYHCLYCGAMVMAGIPHIDYADTFEPGYYDRLAETEKENETP